MVLINLDAMIKPASTAMPSERVALHRMLSGLGQMLSACVATALCTARKRAVLCVFTIETYPKA